MPPGTLETPEPSQTGSIALVTTPEPSQVTAEGSQSALPESTVAEDTVVDEDQSELDASVEYTLVKGKSGRRYRVYNVIGKGGYGVVHKAAYEMRDGHFLLLAIKSENTDSLDVEVRVLLKMRHGSHFCALFDEGFDTYSQTKFIVMTYVGDNLSSLRRQFGWFSWGTVLRVGMQTLHAIEQLHDRGYLSRDVKPSNFAVGAPQALRRLVYMLDFGIARSYTDENGNPLPRRKQTSFRGTSRYCALPQHKESDQCRRDDVESWFYMLVELSAGRLPWACFSRHEKDKIADAKRKARTLGRKAFLAHCPSQFELIMDVVDRWPFESIPDYDGLLVVLARILESIGVDFQDRYDWETLDKYRECPVTFVAPGPPRLYDHCIFVDRAELQKLVDAAPLETK
uniref:Protein kinase domain-containing protein n=1 Tax=Panagrellus redivivus TaxID=6233 RepID=A0A7E4ZR32_PANRE